MSRIDDHLRNALDVTPQSDPEMTGNWSVYRTTEDGNRVLVEGDLPEEIARQMVADYAAEGDTTLEAVEG
ncbi:MAG: hypothetical protein KDA93_02175 [Planctomycetaceae bacterium]|nr:hypothetical protein [Planctomycetaceae bacterium]